MSSYEYHQILQFLYFEGYADSYEEAEELVESLNDNEFEELICEAEVDNRKRLSADQKKIIRNRRLSPEQRLPVRGETPADTEGRLTQTRQNQTARDRGGRGVRGSQLGKYKKHSEYGGVTFQSDFYPEKVKARLEKLRAKSAKNNIRSFREEVVEYLFVEGYAETIESAELMAENISDNWVNVILDEDAEELVESLNYDEFEELNEARRKLAHSFPLKPSEKRSADNIKRMNDGDFSVPPGGSVRVRSSRKNEPEPEEKKSTGKRRRTDMSKVIVAHYLFDEGYADSLNGAEVMAESISDNWVQSILSESDIESPKERLVADRNMFNIPQSERDAAKERTIAKAKAAREKKKNR